MPVAEKYNKDFKRFRIRPLHYENSHEGSYDLFFNSIITEFSDSWTPRWSTEMAYGRMDPLSFYSGTGRELTFGFRIVSDDANEAKKNMVKIQDLIKYQYPSMDLYSFFRRSTPTSPARAIDGIKPFGLIKAPPYFELQFLNLFNSHGINTLRAYINGAIQISPGFQGKEQSQYFSSDFKEIYFSDVTITLRMQVVHDSDLFLGTANINVNGQVAAQTEGAQSYPYGISRSAAENINSHAVNSNGTPTNQTAANAASNTQTPAQAANNGQTPTGIGSPAEVEKRINRLFPNATEAQKNVWRRLWGNKDMGPMTDAVNSSDDASTEAMNIERNREMNKSSNVRKQYRSNSEDLFEDEFTSPHPDPSRR
jgi:hypothetical protein